MYGASVSTRPVPANFWVVHEGGTTPADPRKEVTFKEVWTVPLSFRSLVPVLEVRMIIERAQNIPLYLKAPLTDLVARCTEVKCLVEN